jgi:hypothetical protein
MCEEFKDYMRPLFSWINLESNAQRLTTSQY